MDICQLVKNAKSDFELLDAIRCRHQMYAQDIKSLFGIVCGYNLAKDIDDNLSDFRDYMSKLKQYNSCALHWTDYIQKISEREVYEIPVFFKYLDEFRKLNYECLGEVKLDSEQRFFNFNQQCRFINMDYPELPIKPPHLIKVMKMPNNFVYCFYYDESGFKFYEHGTQDLTYTKSLIRKQYNVDENLW